MVQRCPAGVWDGNPKSEKWHEIGPLNDPHQVKERRITGSHFKTFLQNDYSVYVETNTEHTL